MFLMRIKDVESEIMSEERGHEIAKSYLENKSQIAFCLCLSDETGNIHALNISEALSSNLIKGQNALKK